VQFDDPSYRGGANKESLDEARANFRNLGAKNADRVAMVRKPLPEEIAPTKRPN
jgi:hypothetical protein